MVLFRNKIQIDDEERVFPLSNGSGCWLSYIQFDDKVMWRWDDPFDLWQSQKDLLPTDSCLRSDRNYLLQDKLDLAQKSKLRFILIELEMSYRTTTIMIAS